MSGSRTAFWIMFAITCIESLSVVVREGLIREEKQQAFRAGRTAAFQCYSDFYIIGRSGEAWMMPESCTAALGPADAAIQWWGQHKSQDPFSVQGEGHKGN